MKVTSSYKVEMLQANRKTFQETVDIYHAALSFLLEVYESEWAALSAIERTKERFNVAEKLVHSTKDNAAKYDFDIRFFKMPVP